MDDVDSKNVEHFKYSSISVDILKAAKSMKSSGSLYFNDMSNNLVKSKIIVWIAEPQLIG